MSQTVRRLEQLARVTKSRATDVEDLDNPGRTPGIHTTAVFAPREKLLPEGALTPDDPGIRFLPNRRSQARHVGPRPLPGHVLASGTFTGTRTT